MTEIFSRIKLNTRQIVGTVVFVVASVIAQMVIPSMLSKMIDDGVSGQNAKLVINIHCCPIKFQLINSPNNSN